MNNTDYRNILDIESQPDYLPISSTAIEVLLRTMSAAGELAGVVKKMLFTGKPVDREKVTVAVQALQRATQYLPYIAEQSGDGVVGKLMPIFKHPFEADAINPRLLHAVFGKFDESGELAEALLQAGLTGKFDRVNFQEELGDDRFYTEIALDELFISMDDLQAQNWAKLKDPSKGRYRNGFSTDASENRDKAAERELLESVAK